MSHSLLSQSGLLQPPRELRDQVYGELFGGPQLVFWLMTLFDTFGHPSDEIRQRPPPGGS